jgi:hypothetical protein
MKTLCSSDLRLRQSRHTLRMGGSAHTEDQARWGKVVSLQPSPRRTHHHGVQFFPLCRIIFGLLREVTFGDFIHTNPSQFLRVFQGSTRRRVPPTR